jgi:hypothetical protein
MTDETSDLVYGVLIVAVALPVLYFLAQLMIKIGNIWSAHVLAPLAPAFASETSLNGGIIMGRYRGCHLRAGYEKDKNDSWYSDNSVGFNAFYVEAIDLTGQSSWSIKFHVSGILGQGPKKLLIHTADTSLGERLSQSGVLEAVANISTPSEDYVTVAFDERRKVLTYVDDVSPKRIPSLKQFAAQLELVAHLVEVNEKVNHT